MQQLHQQKKFAMTLLSHKVQFVEGKKKKETEFNLNNNNKKMEHTHHNPSLVPHIWPWKFQEPYSCSLNSPIEKKKKISVFRTHRNPTLCQEIFLESLVKISFFHFSINSCFSNFEKSFALHLHWNNSPSDGGSQILLAHFKNTFLH